MRMDNNNCYSLSAELTMHLFLMYRQKYYALYNRGWDEWIEQRRLDQPAIIAPSNALTAYPVRFTYNIDEQNINTANYNAASTAIGGDKVTTKLFWDKF